MKKILAGVLVALSLVFGGCQSRGIRMAPIQIQPVVAETAATKIATEMVETTTATPTVNVTPTAETTVAKKTETGAAEGKAPAPEPNPWEQADWGWVRATWAATGKHDYLTGTIGSCQKLAAVIRTCFFTEENQEKRQVEFGYDGTRTYFVAYEVGDTRIDIRELGLERQIWHIINGDLLFPLCGSGKVDVYRFESDTGSKSTWC